MPRPERIETERLVLRAPERTDAPALALAMKRNARHLAPWVPRGQNGPRARVPDTIAQQRRAWREDRGYSLLVLLRGEDRVIGRVALNNVVRGVFHNAYLGYWIDATLQGRGLMTEAVRASIDWAFSRVRLHRVQAAIMPRNFASIRVVEKLGFQAIGRSPKYLKIAGRWEDHVLYATTREAWRGSRRSRDDRSALGRR